MKSLFRSWVSKPNTCFPFFSLFFFWEVQRRWNFGLLNYGILSFSVDLSTFQKIFKPKILVKKFCFWEILIRHLLAPHNIDLCSMKFKISGCQLLFYVMIILMCTIWKFKPSELQHSNLFVLLDRITITKRSFVCFIISWLIWKVCTNFATPNFSILNKKNRRPIIFSVPYFNEFILTIKSLFFGFFSNAVSN